MGQTQVEGGREGRPMVQTILILDSMFKVMRRLECFFLIRTPIFDPVNEYSEKYIYFLPLKTPVKSSPIAVFFLNLNNLYKNRGGLWGSSNGANKLDLELDFQDYLRFECFFFK